jgi:ParB/RepB/Spo0J family partition protein
MVEVREIDVEKIFIPESRARATFSDEQHEELVASIKTHGFTIPILVSPMDDGRFLLIDGEHRVKIAKELGMKRVPAVITKGDEKQITLLNVLANTARGTQNPMDVAEMLKKCHDAGVSEEELAAAVGHTVEWVRFYIALTQLSDFYKEKLRSGELKVGHFREAIRLPTVEEVESALQSALIHKWTVEDLKYYVDRRLPIVKEIMKNEGPEALPPPPTPEQAKEVVLYGTCLACGRKVKRAEMRMPMICQDCYDFLMYFASQFKDTRKAMEELYKAYTFYQDAIRARRPKITKEEAEISSSEEEKGIPAEVENAAINEEEELDEETLRLAKQLKKLKQRGLI